MIDYSLGESTVKLLTKYLKSYIDTIFVRMFIDWQCVYIKKAMISFDIYLLKQFLLRYSLDAHVAVS